MKNLTCFLFLVANIAFSQTPCVSGFAGKYPCKDYDLISHISNDILGGFGTEGNDNWGWTDPETQKEYALMGINSGIVFIDISNPVAPIILGTLKTRTVNSVWRDVKVYKSHAFIVSEASNHGMQVFDLKRLRTVNDPPIEFQADVNFLGFGTAHNIVINEKSGYAYIVGASRISTYRGGPIFININNPLNPIIEGGFAEGGYSHDAQVVTYNGPDTDYTGKEILIGSNENEVVIADVTNKTAPTIISKISYPNVFYAHQGWFTEDFKYFILGDELDEQNIGNNSKSVVFDFTDLNNPKIHFNYFGPTAAIDHNGYVKENLFYQANYTAGVRMIDISNINNRSFIEVGFFDTYPENNATSFNGAWNVYPYFSSGNIIISDINNGFFVIRKSGTLGLNTQNRDDKAAIYPNPMSSSATISLSNKQQIKSIKIYTLLGQKVFENNNINKPEYIVTKNNFSTGVYLLQINNSVVKKLVIQ